MVSTKLGGRGVKAQNSKKYFFREDRWQGVNYRNKSLFQEEEYVCLLQQCSMSSRTDPHIGYYRSRYDPDYFHGASGGCIAIYDLQMY